MTACSTWTIWTVRSDTRGGSGAHLALALAVVALSIVATTTLLGPTMPLGH